MRWSMSKHGTEQVLEANDAPHSEPDHAPALIREIVPRRGKLILSTGASGRSEHEKEGVAVKGDMEARGQGCAGAT